MRTAIGFTIGPDTPPVLFASANVLRLISIFIPVNVLIKDTASAPPASAALAISCPNVNAGFLALGQNARHVEELTGQIKKLAKQPVIMKLTPNVTDVTEIEGLQRQAEQMQYL